MLFYVNCKDYFCFPTYLLYAKFYYSFILLKEGNRYEMFQNFNVKCIYLHIILYVCTDHYSYMYRMLKFVIFRLLVDKQVYHGYLTLDSL